MSLVAVSAADRAAETCQRWVPHSLRGDRAKVSKGRSQSPLVVPERHETLTCGGYAATPCRLPQKEDHPQQWMVEDILFPPQLCVSQQKGLSSVSLTADCSLCRGSQGRPLPQYQHEKTTATAVVFSSSRRMSAAALSAAVGSRQPIEDRTHSQAEPTSKNRTPRTPAALREGARGRGFSQRSRLPRIPPIPASLFESGPGGGASL